MNPRGWLFFCPVVCDPGIGTTIIQGEGVFLGKPKDSVWEDWGTLGKIRGKKHPTLKSSLKGEGV